MKRCFLLLLALTLALSLAACGAAQDAASPEPASGSTAEPTPEPTPAPTPEPTPSHTEEEYIEMGISAIADQKLMDAIACFENCTSDKAQDYLAVLYAIRDKDYYLAAQSALELNERYPRELSLWYWQRPIRDAVNALETSDPDVRLAGEAAVALLSERELVFGAGVAADLLDSWGLGTAYGATIGPIKASSSLFLVESLDYLYENCGTAPAGKILVVRCQYDYPKEGAAHCAIDLGVMRYLPAERCPASLAEVEYMVIVTYDYSPAGTWHKTSFFGSSYDVDGLRLKASVETIRLPARQACYSMYGIQASSTPDPLSGTTKWACTEPPEIGQYLIAAVTSALR